MDEEVHVRRVIGIGETILDIIFKDNKVVSAVPGGSTFNSLISLGRCKATPLLLSEVGNDKAGEYIIDFMKANNVATEYMLRIDEMSTPISLAFLNELNDAAYSFYRSEPFIQPDMFFPEIDEDDIILFGSYYAIDFKNRERVKALIEYAKKRGAIIYYDVNFRQAHKPELVRLMPNIIENLELADIVRGSKEDFLLIYNIEEAEEVYSKEVSFYATNFIYTNSSEPTVAFGQGEFTKAYHIEAINTLSTIGAGDSFNAGIIFALIKNKITHTMLADGLLPQQWDRLIGTALRFAANCCESMFNYITEDFAQQCI